MHAFTRFFQRQFEASPLRDLSLLCFVFATSFFIFLGRAPLFEPDEGRYAEIPREMLESGDFITPFLNYVKYFEKPPLLYWLNALSMKVFGQSEFAVRFPSALCGLLTVLLTYHLGRKLFDRRSGFFAALILGTSLGFLVQGRIAIIDMTLTLCMTAAIGFFIVASQEGEEHKALYYYLSYLGAALALLAKGLIAIVLPGGIVFCYLLLTGRWRLLKEMRLFTGILLFFVVGAPWFILVSLRNPEFAHFFFIQEHVQRFLTKIHNRYEPFWFFIPVLLGTMLPWSLFIPATFRQLWLQRRQQGWSNRLYLFLWFAVIFIFFSKSNSKLVPYILPLFPALALLLGEGFANTLSAKSISFTMAAWLSVTLFALIGAAAICYPLLLPDPLVTPWEGLFVGVIFLGSATWIGMVIRRQETIHLLFTISLAAFLLSIIAPAIALPTIAARKTEKDLGLFIRDHVPKTTVVVSSGLKQGLSFYARRRIVVLRDPGEIEFGSKLGDQSSWFLSNEEFSKLWRSATPVVIQIKEDELPWLNQISPKQTAIIYDQEERVLVSNQH